MTIEIIALLVTLASAGGTAGCTTMAIREVRRADRDELAGIGAALRSAHAVSPEPLPPSFAELLDQLRDA
jgi:hypothetical protein